MERFEREKVNKRTPPTVEQLAMVAESVVGKTGADWAREGLCMCVCGGGGEYMRNKLERIQGYTSTTKATRMTTRCTSNHYTPRFVSRILFSKKRILWQPGLSFLVMIFSIIVQGGRRKCKGQKKKDKKTAQKKTPCAADLSSNRKYL